MRKKKKIKIPKQEEPRDYKIVYWWIQQAMEYSPMFREWWIRIGVPSWNDYLIREGKKP